MYLSASEGYNTVHQKYFEACVASGKRAAKYHSFRNIWLQCLPHIQFMTPRTDVCHHCEDYRVLISKATSEVDKVRLAQEFKEHVELAQKERQYYLDSMKKAEESVCDGPPLYCHYTFSIFRSCRRYTETDRSLLSNPLPILGTRVLESQAYPLNNGPGDKCRLRVVSINFVHFVIQVVNILDGMIHDKMIVLQ